MFLFRSSFFHLAFFVICFMFSAAFGDATAAPSSGSSKASSASPSIRLSDDGSDLLNKTMAAISDLSFYQDIKTGNSTTALNDRPLSNKQFGLIEGAATTSGSRQYYRVQGEKVTMRDTATAGLLFSNDPAAVDACRDLGAQMQALYAYFVFPLDDEFDESLFSGGPAPVSGSSGGVIIPGR